MDYKVTDAEDYAGEDDLEAGPKHYADHPLRRHLAYHREDVKGEDGDDDLLYGDLDDGPEFIESPLEGG